MALPAAERPTPYNLTLASLQLVLDSVMVVLLAPVRFCVCDLDHCMQGSTTPAVISSPARRGMPWRFFIRCPSRRLLALLGLLGLTALGTLGAVADVDAALQEAEIDIETLHHRLVSALDASLAAQGQDYHGIVAQLYMRASASPEAAARPARAWLLMFGVARTSLVSRAITDAILEPLADASRNVSALLHTYVSCGDSSPAAAYSSDGAIDALSQRIPELSIVKSPECEMATILHSTRRCRDAGAHTRACAASCVDSVCQDAGSRTAAPRRLINATLAASCDRPLYGSTLASVCSLTLSWICRECMAATKGGVGGVQQSHAGAVLAVQRDSYVA